MEFPNYTYNRSHPGKKQTNTKNNKNVQKFFISYIKIFCLNNQWVPCGKVFKS